MKMEKKKILKFDSEAIADQASIVKKEEYERLIYSEVYAPNRPDSDGAFMTADNIKQMAHRFIASGKMGQIDLFHDNNVVEGCVVVESFIAREGDPTFIEGAWVVGIYIGNDAVWQAILGGTINGLSVEAITLEEEVAVTIENAGEITGFTTTIHDHKHTFKVLYGEEGEFLGGVTDEVNGHFHKITVGTVTGYATDEAKNTHKHKFSFIENVIVTEQTSSQTES